MKLLFLVFLFLPSLAFGQPPLKSIYLNNGGTEDLKEQRVAPAQQKYLRALSEDPFNYVARINLGVTFVFNDEIEKARKEFEIPLRGNASSEIKYLAHFNTGRAHHQAKEVEPALNNYQKSLLYKKDSIQAKANIELIVQQQNGQGQGGSGDEQQNENNENQDQKGQGNQKDKEQDQQDQGENDKDKKEKKPQDLSEKDIEKILEELKNQEQKIRALEYGKKSKEDPNGKTW